MSLLGNIIWILLGGIWTAIGWLLLGIVFCITVVGIPLGLQCFKMATLTLAPFGKTIEYGGGAPSFVANVFWVIFAGIPMCIAYLIAGVLNCITIIGIPFGLQSFKMAKLSLLPFGASVLG
ncbi:YccF domain-containing protein [Collinsella tanakaei]|uniref:YccF domain-containing protein n=1 Tax=Collinsella tanakaei TaxID=626935 RepID=UPI001F2F7C00|nr:YccF domain-containing protein [Collinsella tanakaei]MCF2621344.1 YccF domain-containing protein [Collinsella tanakaei]MDM8301031.1 YccF domain-containing protein [Collinsella tanakaei]